MPMFHLWRHILEVSQKAGGAENLVRLHHGAEMSYSQCVYLPS